VLPIVGALTAIFVAAASLALPWVAIGSSPGRSSIDLIGSANALDVVSGPTLALILGTWLAIPVAAAAALLLGASGRWTGAAVVVLVVSVLIELAALAIATSDVVGLAWGGLLGLVAAILATGAAILAIVGRRGPSGALDHPGAG
jgi:hypothetical protein